MRPSPGSSSPPGADGAQGAGHHARQRRGAEEPVAARVRLCRRSQPPRRAIPAAGSRRGQLAPALRPQRLQRPVGGAALAVSGAGVGDGGIEEAGPTGRGGGSRTASRQVWHLLGVVSPQDVLHAAGQVSVHWMPSSVQRRIAGHHKCEACRNAVFHAGAWAHF